MKTNQKAIRCSIGILFFLLLFSSFTFGDTIFSDDFSGAYPGDWVIANDDPSSTYVWAWPSGYAHVYSDPEGGTDWYPDNLSVYMERQGIDLSGYVNVSLSFYYICDTEEGADLLSLRVMDQSGTWHTLWTASGPTDPLGWTYLNLDLGQFAGQSGLTVQFRFDSNDTESGDPYHGVYLDSVTLSADTGDKADLRNVRSTRWNDLIPIGIEQLTAGSDHDYEGPYPDNLQLYFNWGSQNNGYVDATNYRVHVEVTGDGGGTFDWTIANTPAGSWTYLTTDRAVGPLAAGEHTFRIWLDYDGSVDELNEDNNYYERTITVESATPQADLQNVRRNNWDRLIPIGVTRLAAEADHYYDGPYTDDQILYFNWGSRNNGNLSATNYRVHVEISGEGGGSFDWTIAATDPNSWTYLLTDQPVGPLAAGEHTFRIWLDYDGVVDESNEDNNYCERTIAVHRAGPQPAALLAPILQLLLD